MDEVKTQRKYDSPLREQQAGATRRAVLEAGRTLFLEQGYQATTVGQIAARAGVSKPTVFAAAGNKPKLLAAVRDVAMAGDDEPVALADRPEARLAFAGTTPQEVIDGFAALSSGISRRYARIDSVLRSAAATDPTLRELWETSEQQRHKGAALFVDALLRVGRLRADLDRESAIDVVWLLIAPDQYARLVDERGWTPERHQEWLAHALTSLLLETTGRGQPTR